MGTCIGAVEVEIGAIVLLLCATEGGICWHSRWATAVEQASTDSGDAEEIGATALPLCTTEVGICWHSCRATAVDLASTDSGDAEEARRSCEIEATSPCPTGEGGGAIADCCEVRISISEKSGASSNEDGADNRQGVSFMVNRYLERRFAINKNSSSSSSDARTYEQTFKDLSTDNQGLTNSPCTSSCSDARTGYQTFKD